MSKYIRVGGKLYRAVDKSEGAAAQGLKKEYDKLVAQWNAKVDALKKDRAVMQKHFDNLSERASKLERSIDKEDEKLWDAYIAKYFELYPERRKVGWTKKGLNEGKKAHPELLALFKKWQDFGKENKTGADAAFEVRRYGEREIGNAIVEKTKFYDGWRHIDQILDRLKMGK